MPAGRLQTFSPPAEPTSLGEKLLDVVANPAEVFAEVAAAPPTPANWRVPMLLVCLTNLILIVSQPLSGQTSAIVRDIAKAANVPSADVVSVASNYRLISMLAACAAAIMGTFWSAFVLWLMGRIFLKARFSYGKSLEVAGLSGFILVLGAIATAFVTAIAGDDTARPALSILLLNSHPSESLRGALDVFNAFYLWSVALMAVGLSKLSATSFKESAFWVFGYWLVLRVLLLVMGA